MEAASKKRGRPRKFADEEAIWLRRRFPGVSERRRQDLFYAGMASEVLNAIIKHRTAEDPKDGRSFVEEHEWILHRPGILAELGRILGKDWEPGKPEAEEPLSLFLGAVGWLGRAKPSTKKAVAVLKRKRTGKAKPARRDDIARKIAKAIDEYRAAHPDTDYGLILRALDDVGSRVRSLEGKDAKLTGRICS